MLYISKEAFSSFV